MREEKERKNKTRSRFLTVKGKRIERKRERARDEKEEILRGETVRSNSNGKKESGNKVSVEARSRKTSRQAVR